MDRNRELLTIADGSNMHEELESMQTGDIVLLEFARQNVMKNLTGDAIDRLQQLSDSKDFTQKISNSLFIVFQGWDSDPREISQIPECVKFLKAIDETWPYWLNFLSPDSMMTLYSAICSVEMVTIEGGVSYSFTDDAQVKAIQARHSTALVALHRHHGISADRTQANLKTTMSVFC